MHETTRSAALFRQCDRLEVTRHGDDPLDQQASGPGGGDHVSEDGAVGRRTRCVVSRCAGQDAGMNTSRRALLAVPAAVLLLSACGGGEGAPADALPPPATPEETAMPPLGESGSGTMADLEFEDQTGAGESVVVATVNAPGGGFVVVSADDEVLGATDVQVGTTPDVQVDLDPALTEDTELTATLYADTDTDGEFDPAVDEPVPEPVDATDDEVVELDETEPLEETAEYTVG